MYILTKLNSLFCRTFSTFRCLWKMKNKSPESNVHGKVKENGKSKRILPEFSSPVFRLNSFFCRLQYKKGKSDDAEKGFCFHFFRLSRLPRLLRTIMMIEEMDFKGDGRINKTIFHLHQASSFPSLLSRYRESLWRGRKRKNQCEGFGCESKLMAEEFFLRT